ncbi:MAG: HAMP domain-containing protein [Gammaproteobacteria bacterium]|nr:HAMP domain-containing protein [Gammaproteobacteria bacterium]
MRRLLFRTLPLLALLVALLVALLLVSGVQTDAGDLLGGDGYLWVLLVSVAALAILLWGIGYRLAALIRNVRSGAPGALLAARWVRNFLALSLPPALIVFFFSAWFLSSTIDSWFDVRVEAALADSLQLGQEFLDTRTLEVRNQLVDTAAALSLLEEDGDALRRALLGRVRAAGPSELSIMGTDGTLVATANINALTGLPERPGDFAVVQATQQGEYAAAEPTTDGDLQIRVLLLMPPSYPGSTPQLLQAIYPLPADITTLTGSIEQEYHRYQNVSYLRQSLKQSFLLILTLVLMLTVLLALLAALNASKRMVSPLSRLSTATREVAAGDFGREVATAQRDEIGFLVESFNQMTKALKAASQEAEAGRARLAAQGEYLETVLGNLSSGVLTLDQAGRLITLNESGRQILGLPSGFLAERADAGSDRPGIEDLSRFAPFLAPFAAEITRQTKRERREWQQEVRIDRPGTPLVLLMRGSRLPLIAPSGDEPTQGQVVVFDDVTVLNQAQREAAWAEAARRLAHEVKNPLTPIRLAAERLHMKLSPKLESDDGDILDRASNTIVSQVEALRKLVDAFGDYAREPELSREPVNLDELVRDVVGLYQQGDARLRFELALEGGAENLAADSGRLRQMLHNLIRNAQEAGDGDAVHIRIRSALGGEPGQQWLELVIADDGPGFPAMVLENPFEPYVTNKSKGSGLGLAICRKIVSEHDGQIALENDAQGGAKVTIRLPITRS